MGRPDGIHVFINLFIIHWFNRHSAVRCFLPAGPWAGRVAATAAAHRAAAHPRHPAGEAAAAHNPALVAAGAPALCGAGAPFLHG
jgi:hypothetical protein